MEFSLLSVVYPFAIPYFCFQFPLDLSLFLSSELKIPSFFFFFSQQELALESTNMWKYILEYYIDNILYIRLKR